ncbi:MAG: hypothetical protein HZB39_00135 [Planctomycetes bacterium]|nr:hypothetical protein [Planctomycetota bacterium]
MRTLLAALVLLIAAAGTWWLLGDGDETVAPTPTSSGDAIASPAPGPRESAPLPDAPSTRDAIESPPASVPYVFRIKVVRDDDGAPVEGAELRVGPSEMTWRNWPLERRRAKGEDYEDYVFRAGRVWRSDPSGQASIGHDEIALAVFVRSGDLHAGGHFRLEDGKQSGDFELRLMRDATLVFLAVDDSGAPVEGVYVRATTIAGPDDSSWSTTRWGFGPSNAAGRITVRHAQTLRSRARNALVCDVSANVLGPEGEAVRVTLDPLPADPITVRIPPCARLEVVALDANGAPWTFAPGEHAVLSVTASGSFGGRSEVFGADGVARVGAVACNAKINLSCDQLGGAELNVRAPERAGDTMRVGLRVPADAAVLTGRLVAVDGNPLRGEFDITLRVPNAGGDWNITAGEDGRFRLATQLLRAGAIPTIQVFGESQDKPPRPLVAPLVIARTMAAGINDLGNIVLAPAPELVSGRIEWNDGSAGKGIDLFIERETEPRGWRSDSTARVRVAADGTFVAWGLRDQRQCRIAVGQFKDALPTDPIAFAPGARDVVVRLERGSTLEPTFLVDHDTPWRTFKFSLSRGASEPVGSSMRRTAPDDAGRMRVGWRTIPAGKFRLAVSLPGERVPLVAVDDIVVSGGLALDDPRLRDIDLRGRMQRCELLIVDPDERPIAEPPPRLSRADGGPSSVPCQAIGPGRFELALSSPMDVSITAPGYRMREHRAVAGLATVRMERAPEYRLRCRATLPPRTALRLRISLLDPRTGRVEPQGRDEQRLAIDSDEPMSWSPGTDGSYAIEIAVARGAAPERVTSFEPTRIEVRTLIPGQIIEIVPDPVALAAALAKLKD